MEEQRELSESIKRLSEPRDGSLPPILKPGICDFTGVRGVRYVRCHDDDHPALHFPHELFPPSSAAASFLSLIATGTAMDAYTRAIGKTDLRRVLGRRLSPQETSTKGTFVVVSSKDEVFICSRMEMNFVGVS